MAYFIKYKDLAIYCDISPMKLSMSVYKQCEVFVMDSEYQFELLRTRHPYSQCIKMDLQEQLTRKNLGKTMPRKIREFILSIPEVKLRLREDKINEILEI